MSRLSGAIVTFLLMLSISISGVTALQISNIGTSAEMIGKAGIEGFDQSASSIFQNPASLSKIEGNSASMFYSQFLKDSLKYMNLSIASQTRFGTFGLGFMQARVDDIYETVEVQDGSGNLEVGSTFAYKNTLLKFGYQNKYKNIMNIGANFSYYLHDLNTVTGKGMNLDLGGLAYIKKFTLSLSVKNIVKISKIRYTNDQVEELPLSITPSVAYKRNNNMYYYQQIIGLNGGYTIDAHSAGLSYNPPWLKKIISLTGGIKNIRINEKNGYSTKYSIGVSLKTTLLGFHFAMESSDFYDQNYHYFFSTDIHL